MSLNPQDDPDYKEYQDYLDYQDYQKYLKNPTPQSQGLLQPGASLDQRATDVSKTMPFAGKIMAATNKGISPEQIPKTIANTALPGMGAAATKGAGILGRLGVNALMGGTMAETQNPDASLPDKAKNFATGAALGGAGSAVGEIGGLLGKGPISDSLDSFANKKALKAAGAMTRDLKQIEDKNKTDQLGSFLLDQNHVKPFSTVSKVADSLAEAKQKAGQAIGDILDTADAAQINPTINARNIALTLSDDPEILGLSKIPGKESTSNQINKFLETLYKNGEQLSLRDAQKLRQGIDSSINFNKRVPDMAGAQPYLYKIRDAISNGMNDAVNSLATTEGGAGGDVINRLKNANRDYSTLAQLEQIASDRASGLAANRSVSLTDTIAGAGGMALGHTPLEHAAGALAIGGINKFGRTFGNPLMATGAKALSQGAVAPVGLIPAGLLESEKAKGLLKQGEKK